MRAAKVALKFGIASFIGVSAYTRLSEPSRCLLAHRGSQNPYYYDPPFRWNFNWDRRDPKGYVEGPKSKSVEDSQDSEKHIKCMTPTASRHILLVRHGQYMEMGTLDKDRCLTPLGRHQADITGRRLKELSLPYKSMTSSTMTRAHETALLIQVHTPQLNISCDPCLSEGAPAQPEPVSSNWRPSPEPVDIDSNRNLTIIGTAIFLGFMMPYWITKSPQSIETGLPELDGLLKTLLSNSAFVAGAFGFFLDNTVPGTLKERGLKSANQVQEDNKDSTVRQKAFHVYRIPGIPNCYRRSLLAKLVPVFDTVI